MMRRPAGPLPAVACGTECATVCTSPGSTGILPASAVVGTAGGSVGPSGAGTIAGAAAAAAGAEAIGFSIAVTGVSIGGDTGSALTGLLAPRAPTAGGSAAGAGALADSTSLTTSSRAATLPARSAALTRIV